MNRAFQIRKHQGRVVTPSDDYGSGTVRPGLRLSLEGPNGSPAGSGPKAWPGHMPVRRYRSNHHWAKTGWARRNHGHYSWTNSLYIPLPHIKWMRAYKLRRLGALRLYQAQYRVAKRLL